ncbi:uncharacterized protein [Linepithema humile]|uniref:uncharacterized protein n=1 Tax=Linepithema humile TaxID=83485 RepID=UPI00351ED597
MSKRSKLNDNSEIKLNFDEKELLILEVQKRPPLWDYSLPLMQRRCTIKQRLWAEIVLALNGKISIEKAQKKFKSLHDTYRKIIQSEKRMSGSARRDTVQNTVSNINSSDVDSSSSLTNDENNSGYIKKDFNEGRRRNKLIPQVQ